MPHRQSDPMVDVIARGDLVQTGPGRVAFYSDTIAVGFYPIILFTRRPVLNGHPLAAAYLVSHTGAGNVYKLEPSCVLTNGALGETSKVQRLDPIVVRDSILSTRGGGKRVTSELAEIVLEVDAYFAEDQIQQWTNGKQHDAHERFDALMQQDAARRASDESKRTTTETPKHSRGPGGDVGL